MTVNLLYGILVRMTKTVFSLNEKDKEIKGLMKSNL